MAAILAIHNDAKPLIRHRGVCFDFGVNEAQWNEILLQILLSSILYLICGWYDAEFLQLSG